MNSTPLLAHTHQSLVEHLVGVACRAKAAARFFQLHDRSDLQKCRRWREKAFDFESRIPSDDPAWNGVQWRIRDFGKNLPAWIESLPFNTPVEQLAKRRAVDIYTLVVFQHQSALGNAPAHKLFNLVAVRSQTETKEGKPAFRSSGSEFPRNLEDYDGEAPQGEYHVTKDGEIKAGKNGEGVAVIKAMRIVWELLPMKSNAMTS